MLGCELAVLQAPIFDGFSFDPFALFDDGLCPAEVDIGRRHVGQALHVDDGANAVDERGGDIQRVDPACGPHGGGERFDEDAGSPVSSLLHLQVTCYTFEMSKCPEVVFLSGFRFRLFRFRPSLAWPAACGCALHRGEREA